MPFVSKLVKMNLISLASKAILDKPLPKISENKWQKIHNYGIKVPQFSFMQLQGADITLGVEMQSTGEAACFGNSFHDALAKGLISVGYNLPVKGTALVTVGGDQNKQKLVSSIAKLKHLGFKILATEHTAEFFEEKIGQVEIVHKISENFSHVDKIIMGHVHPVFFQEDSVINGQRVWVSIKTKKEKIFPNKSGELEITIIPSFNKYCYIGKICWNA